MTSRLALLLLLTVSVSLYGQSPSRGIEDATIAPISLHFKEGRNAPFEVRIIPPDGVSWPGDNQQTIEVYKDGKKLSSKRVGGEPVMIDAWGAVDSRTGRDPSHSAYIYILCAHRRREANAIYIYEIKETFTIKYCGLVFTKQELGREAEQGAAANP